MIRQAEGVLAWAEAALGRPIPRTEAEIGHDSMLEDDFYAVAQPILKETELDYLVGVTPSMIAFQESKTEVAWDYLSSYQKNLILVSAFDLRKFAREIRRPYDVFLGVLILGQLLVAQSYPQVHFHDDRGCLFDFNDDRTRLKQSVRDLTIEPECLARIPSNFRVAAQSLVGLLRTYPR